MKRAIIFGLAVCVTGTMAFGQQNIDHDEDGYYPGSEPTAYSLDEEAASLGGGYMLIGVGFYDCPVGTIDTTNGAWTYLNDAGFDRCNALSRNAAGVIYAMGDPGVGKNIFTIDTNTGLGTQVALLSPELSVPAMAFSPSDVLYAVHNGTEEDELWIIDAATGAGTLVGEMGFTAVQCMAFDMVSGVLYANDNVEGLLTVDPATGVATDVAPGVGGADIQTITVTPDGTIYGVREDVYTIDPVTGVHTMVAPGQFTDIRGADFLGPIPVELMSFTIE